MIFQRRDAAALLMLSAPYAYRHHAIVDVMMLCCLFSDAALFMPLFFLLSSPIYAFSLLFMRRYYCRFSRRHFA